MALLCCCKHSTICLPEEGLVPHSAIPPLAISTGPCPFYSGISSTPLLHFHQQLTLLSLGKLGYSQRHPGLLRIRPSSCIMSCSEPNRGNSLFRHIAGYRSTGAEGTFTHV